MIQPRKQRIVYSIVVGALAVALISLLVYLFAIGYPRAVPALLYLLGYIVGSLLVYLPTRRVRPRRTLTGRLAWGGLLVLVAVLGIGMRVATLELLGDTNTAVGGFAEGLGFGVALTSLLRLLLPLNSWERNR